MTVEQMDLVIDKLDEVYGILYDNPLVDEYIEEGCIDRALEYLNTEEGIEFKKYYFDRCKDVLTSDRELKSFAIVMGL